MITEDKLRSETAKQLAQMARTKGVSGWHSMRKEDLIKALLTLARKKATAKKANATKAKVAAAKASSSTKVGAKKTAKAAARTSSVKKTAKVRTAKTVKTKSTGKVSKKVTAVKASSIKSETKSDLTKVSSKSKVAAKSPSAQKKAAVKPKPVAEKANPELVEFQRQQAQAKDLAFFQNQIAASDEPKQEKIVLFVRDPFWLQAYWELNRAAVDRVKVSLGEHWHGAQPILRLLRVHAEGTGPNAEQLVREISIHGGVNNWYVDVQGPPETYRVEVGYKTLAGKFQAICRSNKVSTPQPGSKDHVDFNWADVGEKAEQIFSASGGYNPSGSKDLREVFEEKLRRPMNRSALNRFGYDAVLNGSEQFKFVVDAELLVYGQSTPDSQVTIGGEAVQLRPDGSFTVRVNLPDRRKVLPVSSCSPDGTKVQTTVLAIERNTKVMEEMTRDPNEPF